MRIFSPKFCIRKKVKFEGKIAPYHDVTVRHHTLPKSTVAKSAFGRDIGRDVN